MSPLGTKVDGKGGEKKEKRYTYQNTDAVKNIWLCGHVRELTWYGLHMSETLSNIHCLIPTWTNDAVTVPTNWTNRPVRSGKRRMGGLTKERGPWWQFEVVAQF